MRDTGGAPGVGLGVAERGGEKGWERKSIRAGLAKPGVGS